MTTLPLLVLDPREGVKGAMLTHEKPLTAVAGELVADARFPGHRIADLL